jgi:hypothetical protein
MNLLLLRRWIVSSWRSWCLILERKVDSTKYKEAQKALLDVARREFDLLMDQALLMEEYLPLD